MEFDDLGYSVQQVSHRTRAEKILSKDRNAIEKQRLAARHEHFERNEYIEEIIKPQEASPMRIDDSERFNRDVCADQKMQRLRELQMTQARAAARRVQQEEYERSIEKRRAAEMEEDKKRAAISATKDFNEESVLYDLVVNEALDSTSHKGQLLQQQDAERQFKREARSKRIYHSANSTDYDPITGEKRSFW